MLNMLSYRLLRKVISQKQTFKYISLLFEERLMTTLREASLFLQLCCENSHLMKLYWSFITSSL